MLVIHNSNRTKIADMVWQFTHLKRTKYENVRRKRKGKMTKEQKQQKEEQKC